MANPDPIVFLTRPQVGSERFAKALRASFHGPFSIVISPVLKIETLVKYPDLSDYMAVIFTSSHAVDAVNASDDVDGMTAYCVGESTSQKAIKAGFAAVDTGGDAESLIAKVSRDRPEGSLLHLRGVHSRGDIAERLSANGVQTRELVVYDQIEAELGPEANAIIRSQHSLIVPVFSARSSNLLSAHFEDRVPGPHVVAISDEVATSWNAPAKAITVATRPDASSMVRAVVDAIQSDSPC